MKPLDAPRFDSLGRLASISAGYPFRGSIGDLPPGDVAVIQMRNVDPDAGIDWAGLSRIELPRESDRAMLGPGDVILSTRGTRTFAYHVGQPPTPTVCSPHFFVIRPHADALDPAFLAWQINQKAAQDCLATGATGSYILNLKREVVASVPIAVLPMAEQISIVELAANARAERALLTRLIDMRNSEMAAIAARVLAPVSSRPGKRDM